MNLTLPDDPLISTQSVSHQLHVLSWFHTILKVFRVEHGREPTETEKEQLFNQIANQGK